MSLFDYMSNDDFCELCTEAFTLSSFLFWVDMNFWMQRRSSEIISSESNVFSKIPLFIRFLLMVYPMEEAIRDFAFGISPGVNGIFTPKRYFAVRGLKSILIAMSYVM